MHAHREREVCMHMCAHTHTGVHTHAYTHTHRCTHAHRCTHKCTRVCACTHIYTHRGVHAHAGMYTHRCTHMCEHIGVHTMHTCTHTQVFSYSPILFSETQDFRWQLLLGVKLVLSECLLLKLIKINSKSSLSIINKQGPEDPSTSWCSKLNHDHPGV